MDFVEYAREADKTDKGEPEIGRLGYLGLAIAGEAGELANEIKKHYRDDAPTMIDAPMFTEPTDERRVKVLLEAGDVLWYLNRLANRLNSSLEEIAQMNIAKLHERHFGTQQ